MTSSPQPPDRPRETRDASEHSLSTPASASAAGGPEGDPPRATHRAEPLVPDPSPVADPRGALLGSPGLRPVSARLIPVRYLSSLPWYLIGLALIIGAVVLYVLLGWWWVVFPSALILVLIGQSLLLTPRRVRAIGYADGEEDLTVATGVMFREVRTIPYGRVQSVKIDEGPIERRYGLATITLSTAAAGSVVALPGLPREEAERLRALLSDRGISLMAAL